jgi:hypothetical protein
MTVRSAERAFRLRTKRAEPGASLASPPGDAGASTLEYGGLLLLIAAIVAAFAVLALPSFVSDNLSYAFCKALNGGNAAGCESPADVAYKPGCTTNLASDSYGDSGDRGSRTW